MQMLNRIPGCRFDTAEQHADMQQGIFGVELPLLVTCPGRRNRLQRTRIMLGKSPAANKENAYALSTWNGVDTVWWILIYTGITCAGRFKRLFKSSQAARTTINPTPTSALNTCIARPSSASALAMSARGASSTPKQNTSSE